MIGLFAVTDAGRRGAADLAARLGSDAVVVDGPVGPSLRRLWPRLDSAVFFLAADATVRLIAPVLADRHTDPGIVCVDEARRFAVALAGGRSGGADVLAEQVADVLGCRPVVTTATDGTGSTPLDEIVELLDAGVEGDPVSCGAAILDGEPVLLVNPHGFPLPALPDNVGAAVERPTWTVVVDDRRPVEDEVRTLRLIPRTLVVGIGSANDVSRTAVTDTLARLDGEHGLDPRAVRAFATVDSKAAEPGILDAVQDMGFWHSPDGGDELPLRHYPAEQLAAVSVPSPSTAVLAAVGTPSVAEAASLRAAEELGDGAEVELVAGKTRSEHVTVAAARIMPRGRLALVGLGPGEQDQRTPRADAELRRASVVVGSEPDIERIRHLLRPGTRTRAGGPKLDEEQVAEAVSLASAGRAVALAESGGADTGARAAALARQVGADIEVVTVAGVPTRDAAQADPRTR